MKIYDSLPAEMGSLDDDILSLCEILKSSAGETDQSHVSAAETGPDEDPAASTRSTDSAETEQEGQKDVSYESMILMLQSLSEEPEMVEPAPCIYKPVSEPPPKKRGPGRPSKTPAVEPLQRRGIVPRVENGDNRLELLFDQPAVIKSLFSYFENISAQDIHINATPTSLIFYTEDSAHTLKVRAEIDGSQMNSYYCSENFWLVMNSASAKGICKKIDKTFHAVKFINRHSNPTVFEMIFENRSLQKENRFPLMVFPPPTELDEWLEEIEDSASERDDYPVAWSIETKTLKKTHEFANLHAKVVKVEISGDTRELKISFDGSGLPTFDEVYTNPEKISLKSDLREDEIFSINYSCASGTKFARSAVAENVRIFCREESPMLLMSSEGGVSVITTIENIPT